MNKEEMLEKYVRNTLRERIEAVRQVELVTEDDKGNPVGCGNEVEENFGTNALLKVGANTITHILVDKGIVTEEELIQEYNKRAEEYRQTEIKDMEDTFENDVEESLNLYKQIGWEEPKRRWWHKLFNIFKKDESEEDHKEV